MDKLRPDVYNALEVSSYLTVQELALQLDSGTPATQAQVRDVLRAELEVFWPDEERWDLAVFHHFADRPRLFRHRGGSCSTCTEIRGHARGPAGSARPRRAIDRRRSE